MILHTEVLGDGKPIVFLHTGLQTGLNDFIYQRDFFKDTYKIILPDLRGHGYSIEDDFSNFFEDSATDLSETLNHLKVEDAHIVGCSLGALVGLFFAKRFPHKTRSLTISGIFADKPSNWTDLHKEDVKSQSELLKNDDMVHYFNHIHQTNWRQFLDFAKDDTWYPFEETRNLNTISSPVLYMVGEGNKAETKGAITYPSIKEDIHVCILPFASHLVHTEQPEIYSTILEQFLIQVDKENQESVR